MKNDMLWSGKWLIYVTLCSYLLYLHGFNVSNSSSDKDPKLMLNALCFYYLSVAAAAYYHLNHLLINLQPNLSN